MNFIHKIQHRLLLNYPMIWSSRVVPVLLVAGTVNVLLFALFYLVSSPWHRVSFEAWIPFFSLCSIIGVIIYLIYLLRFNSFKVFGKLHWTHFSLQFFLIFISLGSIIAWPFMPQLATHVAVSGRFVPGELDADIRQAYLLANQLEYTKETLPYRKITIEVSDTVTVEENDWDNNYRKVPSIGFINDADYEKVEKKSDSLYIGYERVDLICTYFPYVTSVSSSAINDEIYNTINAGGIDTSQHLEKLSAIFAKYIPSYNGSVIRIPFDNRYSEMEETQECKTCQKYRLSELGSCMMDVGNSMFSRDDMEVVFRIWFYLTFYASLLLVIFRYITARTFLWTLLFTFLLFIFSVIVLIASRYNEDKLMLGMMLFYYTVFASVSFTLFFSKSRNVFQGIALNLSFFCLHLLPIVSAAFFIEMVGRYRVSNKGFIWECAELVGIALVFLSALFYHSRLFYKWYSLPEE